MNEQTDGADPRSRQKGGFALLVICGLLIGIFLLLMALSRFKQGAVVQLSRVVEQERMQLAAQAGLAEIAARIRETLNDPGTSVGAVVTDAFGDSGLAGAAEGTVSWSRNVIFPAAELEHASRVAGRTVGRPVALKGEARFRLTDKIGDFAPSFIGYVEIDVAVGGQGLPTTVSRERRELRLVDLRDPFFDKYLLYVKNICININHPARRLILEGRMKNGALSRAYFGNRFYPVCPEFPQGENGSRNPPLFMDIDFQGDQHLIANFCTPRRGFAIRDADTAAAGEGRFFFVRHPFIPFGNLRSRFRLSDFFSIAEVRDFYEMVVAKSSPHAGVQNSIPWEIMKDFRAAGGKPENSGLFKAIVETCVKGWDYHYGYTDYSHLVGADGSPTGLMSVPAYSGIGSYFDEYKDYNIQRLVGGKMPLLFGETRDKPVLVEGPVFLRFFKVAFFDHFISHLPALGQTFQLNIQEVPLKFLRPDKPADFAARPIGRIDEIGLETVLMSRPVDNLPVNNLFFRETRTRDTPQQAGTPRKGDDIFPRLDGRLRTVTHLFRTSDELLRHTVVTTAEGTRRLSLDGIMVVLGMDGKSLDLSTIHQYAGKGMIVVMRGNCLLGSLRRAAGPAFDALRISLAGGNFSIRGGDDPAVIEAALIATAFRPKDREHSCGFDPNHHAVTIIGQLVVDELFELKSLDEGRPLRIIHDETLLIPDVPPRWASLSPIRTSCSTSSSEDGRIGNE